MLTLFLNGVPAVLGAEGMELNTLLSQSGGVGLNGGAFSYALTLPVNAVNANLLGHPDILSTAHKFNAEYGAVLTDSDVTLLTGLFRLTEVSAAGYTGELLSAEVTWPEQLDGKTLRHLKTIPDAPFIAAQTGDYNYEWYLSRNADQVDIQFPLIGYGNFPDAAYDPANKVFSIGALQFGNLPPAFYVRNLIKYIFAEAGWQVAGPVFADEKACKLLLPFTSEKPFLWPWGSLATALRTDSDGTEAFTQAGSFMQNYPLAGPENPTGVQYTAPADGTYTFSDEFNISVPSGFDGSVSYYHGVAIYSAYFGTEMYNNNVTGSVAAGASHTSLLTYSQPVSEGDLIIFTFITYPTAHTAYSYTRSTGVSLTEGYTRTAIEMAPNLPPIDQLTFVKAFLNLFNLRLRADYNRKTLYFMYGNTGTAPTAEYVSVETGLVPGSAVMKPLQQQAKRFFTYAPDSADALLKPDPYFADASVTYSGSGAQGSQTVKLPFSASKMRRYLLLVSAENSSEKVLNLPFIGNQKGLETPPDKAVPDFNFTPRLLLFTGTAQFAGSPYKVQVSGAFTAFGMAEFTVEGLGWETLINNYYSPLPLGGHSLQIQAYLSPEQFNKLNKGACALLNDENYTVAQMSGYRPGSYKPATLLLLKPEYW